MTSQMRMAEEEDKLKIWTPPQVRTIIGPQSHQVDAVLDKCGISTGLKIETCTVSKWREPLWIWFLADLFCPFLLTRIRITNTLTHTIISNVIRVLDIPTLQLCL